MPAWFPIHPASWEMWAAIGLVFIALDMLLGYSGPLIAMGLAALAMAGVSGLFGAAALPNWSMALIGYAVVAAVCTILARKLIPKPKGKDINEY